MTTQFNTNALHSMLMIRSVSSTGRFRHRGGIRVLSQLFRSLFDQAEQHTSSNRVLPEQKVGTHDPIIFLTMIILSLRNEFMADVRIDNEQRGQ
jgi:hypothetical protein